MKSANKVVLILSLLRYCFVLTPQSSLIVTQRLVLNHTLETNVTFLYHYRAKSNYAG